MIGNVIWVRGKCATKREECVAHDCSARFWCGKVDCPHCDDKYCEACKMGVVHTTHREGCIHGFGPCEDCYTMDYWKDTFHCRACEQDYEVTHWR